MTDVRLQTQIEKAFEDRATINAATRGHARDAVDEALDLLDRGKARVAEKLPGATGPNSWKVNQWLKKAVLLSFRLNDNALIDGGPGQATWWDKSPRSWKVGARTVQGRGLPRRSRRDRAALGLHRPRCRADAELRQSRRLCR